MTEQSITPIFTPYPHQRRVLQARMDGARWIECIWHRRGGKDLTYYNGMIASACKRVGTYFHVFPEANWGRRVWWDGKDNDGRRLIEYMPRDLMKSKPGGDPCINETEMQIEMINGSIYQVVGGDKLSWLGANPVGVGISEFQRMDPMVWQYLTPILLANNGWVWFAHTPLGHNHAYDLYQNTKDDPAWFVDVRTIKDSAKADGSPIVTEEMIEWERNQGKAEALIEQEYYCSFEGNLEGAVYGERLKAARLDGRIRDFAIDTKLPVTPAFDLGMGDATAIGFYQRLGNEHRLIDYYEATGKGLDHYAEVLREKKRDKGYQYELVDGLMVCEGPHDIAVRELGTGKSRSEVARKYGLHFRVGKKLALEDGIMATRRLWNTLWVHETNCKRFLDAAQSYHYEKDEKKGCFTDKPVHDWTSHPMDQLRTYAVAVRDDVTGAQPLPKAISSFDPLADDADYEFNPFSVGV
jgi:hypothetical protein